MRLEGIASIGIGIRVALKVVPGTASAVVPTLVVSIDQQIAT